MNIGKLTLFCALMLAGGTGASAAPLSAAFTYQGALSDLGSPANGTYDLSFSLFEGANSGNAAAGPITNTAVKVTGGAFTVVLDFGTNVFDGTSYWLEVGVRTNGAVAFTALSPRQPLLVTPNAAYALNAGAAATAGTASSVAAANISGTLQLAQLPAAVLTNNASGVNLSGVFSGDGGGLENLNANSITGSFSGSFNMPMVGWQAADGDVEVLGNSSYQILYGGGFVEYMTNSFVLTNLHCAVGMVSGSGATSALLRLFARSTNNAPFNAHTAACAYSNSVTLPTWSGSVIDIPISPGVSIASNSYVYAVFETPATHQVQFAFWYQSSGNTSLPRAPMPYVVDTNGTVDPGETLYNYGSAGYRLDGYTSVPITNLSLYIASLAAQAGALAITNAALLPYNAANSGLASGNVQGAVDQLAANATTLSASVAALSNGPVPRIILPDEFAAVVGDKLQLFVRGMIEAQNPYNLPYQIVCAKGAQYPRYFEYTPGAGDAANQTLTVNVLDYSGAVKATASSTLRIVAAKQAPTSHVTVLCVGDSLTEGGVWPAEFYRRLTQSGGSPAGLGYGNIAFIGNQPMAGYPAQSYVGYGGWTWSTYTNAGTSSAAIITANHDKTVADAQSVWLDSNGNMWVLASWAPGSLKLVNYGGAGNHAMPAAPNVLTYVSEAIHTGTITYTASTPAIESPFNDGSAFSFAGFCSSQGYSSISVCYVLLGWNNLLTASKANAAYPSNHIDIIGAARGFIDKLHADYPGCLVRLVGIEIPSPTGGLGANYGAQDWSTYYELLRTVNGYRLALQSMADDPAYASYVKYVDVAAQFDSENNMPSAATPVNSRNAMLEARGTNGVHPDATGYNQIADAVWRDFVRSFCQ